MRISLSCASAPGIGITQSGGFNMLPRRSGGVHIPGMLVALIVGCFTISMGQQGNEGPEREIEYFKVRHAPYGAVLPAEVVKQMWDQVLAMPADNSVATGGFRWDYLGPFGVNNNISPLGLGRHAGRILDLEMNPSAGLRFSAASGGLWGVAFVAPYPMSDQLNSLAVGAFASHPGEPEVIIVGTGEATVRAGTGIWRTTDAGLTWSSVHMQTSIPTVVFRIAYDPDSSSLVHAATNTGYFRSTDDGMNWVRTLPNGCTDIGFAYTVFGQNIMYTPVFGKGLFASSDKGITWNQVSSPVLPTSDMGRTAMAVSGIAFTGINPPATYVYLSVGSATVSDSLNGIYRSLDGGVSWANITQPGLIAHQLSYNNAIAVSPKNENLVVVGWTKDYRSTDAGQSWTLIDNLDPNNHDNTHDDWHVFRWSDDGNTLAAGNDGGLSFSNDKGVTWNQAGNIAPITQFYEIDLSSGDGQTIVGGAQDNGVQVSTDGGTTWLETLCCDGTSPAVDPTNASRTYAIMNGSRFRSTDSGFHWTNIDNGLPGTSLIRTDAGSSAAHPNVYTSVDANVLYSTDYGDSWISLTARPLPATVWNIEAPHVSNNDIYLFATMGSNTIASKLLRYYLGSWTEVSSGFPGNLADGPRVARVRIHPVQLATVYAVMNGADAASIGKKVFKSTDRGSTWMNISGNIPNIVLTDIAVDPGNDNNLFLASEMGCFKSTDGGGSWSRWNNGMPQANIVTTLRTRVVDGNLSVVAGTYGRSAWVRDAGSADPGRFELSNSDRSIPFSSGTPAKDSIIVDKGAVNGFLSGLTIQIDTLIHPAVGELIITLSHDGIDDTLYNRSAPVGVPGLNFIGTVFDDASPSTISQGTPPFTGMFRPEQPLAQFVNHPPDGPWELTVIQAAGTDSGSLRSWRIIIQPETQTVVDEGRRLPKNISLEQNYPNPFNPGTTIRYGLPTSAIVRLSVYDILGREVSVLVDGRRDAGVYETHFDASGLSSGVYFYRLVTGDFVQTKKLLLLR